MLRFNPVFRDLRPIHHGSVRRQVSLGKTHPTAVVQPVPALYTERDSNR
jgi:hypothetical protein